MRAVKLSYRDAQAIVADLQAWNIHGRGLSRAAHVALDNLTLAMKLRPSVKKARARKETKRRTKKEETAEIRAAVMKRAGNACELCGVGGDKFSPLELHHALGRGKAKQAESNCLGCCRQCHRDITDNRPSAVDVLQAQASKFGQLGYHDTARLLLRRRDFVLARGAA